jgi:ATP-dependent helicase/nuclease subunit B
MLTIYTGREDTDRAAFMFARIGERLDALERGEERGSIAVIVPDQFTLQTERDAFYHLKRKGFMRLEIISLSGLGRRVLAETGRDARTPVGKTGRHMLLSSVLRREAAPLGAFGGQESGRTARAFIERMNDLISELKLHNISPDEIEAAARAETEPILRGKLSDVRRVYSAYEEKIRGKYLDSEDHLRVFATGIPRSDFVRDAEIWIYGFDYLTPRDLDIVQALTGRARGVHITLTGEAREESDAKDARRAGEAFRITNRMIDSLRARALAAGCPCALRSVGAQGGFAARRPPAVAHIEREFFNYSARPYAGESDELTLLIASNYYTEAESAAAEIARLVREAGYRYRDILVICNDTDARAAVIKRVFSEYGLPVFMDRRKNLLHNPVLEYIAALMDVVAFGWRLEDVCRLMKTGMSPVSREQCELLEEYATEYRFRGEGPWREDFERLSPYERADAGGLSADAGDAEPRILQGEEKLAALNAARRLIAAHIQKFTRMQAADRDVRGRTEALYLFLRDEARLPAKTESGVASLRASSRHEYADELSQVWESVMEVFDQMVAVLADTPVSREEYAELLAVGLESIEIGLLPSTTDRILVGTMQRTRAGRVKALFVLGANDGVLPAAGIRDGLLSEEERKRLPGLGGEADAAIQLRAAEEELAIYRNLSRPECRLWISFAVSNPEGGELQPSLIFRRLQEIFPRSLKEDIRSRNCEALERVTTAGGTLGSLILALREAAETGAPDPVWGRVYAYYREHAPREAAMLDRGYDFSNRRNDIGRDYVKRLYGIAPARDAANAAAAPLSIRLSPSSLERYARCPFSHFVSHGLRPREPRVVEIGARERGDLFHKAVMAFSKALTREDIRVSDPDSPWMRLAAEDCEKIINEVFASLVEEARAFGRDKSEQYRLERIRATVGTAARIIAEQVKAGCIDRMYIEEGFGENGRFPPIVHSFDGGAIRIEGRIDRLDVLRGNRAKIIDYKSGAENFDADEARAGWRLQLMLYLMAVTGAPEGMGESAAPPRLKPAGVFYFKIREPRIDCASWQEEAEALTEKADRAIRRRFRLDGVVLDDQELLRAIAGEDFAEPHYVNNLSNILPVRVRADGETGELRLVKSSPGTRGLLDAEAFERLCLDVAQKVRGFCENLLDGVIDARPMRAGTTSACAYCRYKGVCGYDAEFD